MSSPIYDRLVREREGSELAQGDIWGVSEVFFNMDERNLVLDNTFIPWDTYVNDMFIRNYGDGTTYLVLEIPLAPDCLISGVSNRETWEVNTKNG